MTQSVGDDIDRYSEKEGWSNKKKAGLVGIILMILFSSALILVGAYFVNLFKNIDFSETPGGNNGVGDESPIAPVSNLKDTHVDINDDATSLAEIAMQGDTRNIKNILLLGVDYVGNEDIQGHSDTNIILSINKNDNTVRLISLMRDTYVQRPDYNSYYKLNSAYYYGGFAELQKTIMLNYRVQIDKVVAINFSVFEDIVDTIKGIDLELSDSEVAYIQRKAGSSPVKNSDDTYHLEGVQALWHSRNRTITTSENLSNDWGRTSRQRDTLQGIMGKAKEMNYPQMLSAANAIFASMETNFSEDELMAYLFEAMSLLKFDIKEFNFPDEDEYEDFNSNDYGQVLKLTDPVATVLRLHHAIYD